MMQIHFCLDVAGITIRLLALVTSHAVDFEEGDWWLNCAVHLSVSWIKGAQRIVEECSDSNGSDQYPRVQKVLYVNNHLKTPRVGPKFILKSGWNPAKYHDRNCARRTFTFVKNLKNLYAQNSLVVPLSFPQTKVEWMVERGYPNGGISQDVSEN
ncbi:hypothetical protein TNCV_2279441 [Trichonephila clavipes]|uniref:Uncharacterized protein n=1 Tax=Trichonephila clavipes TaxID=2585209 RepID=A0A8X6RB24_TRICX|nr:hypothetical protein TNCV_2279441 [Trichonephila clavipes]